MYLDKSYYPTYWSGCNPIHEVVDWCKVRKLVRDALRGDKINPIVIDGNLGSGNLLTGTHRAAANDILMMLGKEEYLIDWVSIHDIVKTDDIIDALQDLDFDLLDDLLDRRK